MGRSGRRNPQRVTRSIETVAFGLLFCRIMKSEILRREGVCMGLFDKKELDAKQDMKVNLGQLAGGVAGAGAGLLGIQLANGMHERKLLENAKQQTSDKEIAEKNWRILLDLKKGNIQLTDLPLTERDFFAKQLAENTEELDFLIKDTREEKAALKLLGGGKVVPLFGEETPKPNLFQRKPTQVNLTPSNVAPLFKNESKLLFPHRVQNPKAAMLPGLLGIGGAMAAGSLLTKRYMNENAEAKKEAELQKFKEMLALANLSEE